MEKKPGLAGRGRDIRMITGDDNNLAGLGEERRYG